MGLGNLADFLTHQSGVDGGFKRYLPSLEVHFVGADYLECHSGICGEVREFDPAQKGNSVFGQNIRVNHTGIIQDLLKETDTADGLRLHSPCFTISRIIASVSLGASLRKVVLHLGVDHLDKVLKLGCNLVVTLL